MFRNEKDLTEANTRIRAMRMRELQNLAVSSETIHNMSLVEWFELRNGLLAAEALTLAALNRRESRGAHQRDDFPETLDNYQQSQKIMLEDGKLVSNLMGDPS